MLTNNTIKEIEEILSKNKLELPDKDIVLRRCFNENWFSDSLAWLLNPKGSHKLGVKFAKEFLKTIAKNRSSNSYFKSKKSMLKWGKSGRGTTSTNFSLKNASSLREFYLAKGIKKKKSRGARYCDVVFLDLDINDGLFLVIENKLFTSNHPKQLEEYYQLVEEKFKRAKIREFVYLTLDGRMPTIHDKTNSNNLFQNWVSMSWNQDILNIINSLQEDKEHKDIFLLRSILLWLNRLQNSSISILVEKLRKYLLSSATACLIEELNRLGGDKSGSWSEDKTNTNHISLVHSSSSKKPLFIELLPNFTITVQSRRKKTALFEKIIVPFGVHPDQIYNLIDIAARDIYYYHFGDSTHLYLSSKRRLSSTLSTKREELQPLFKYVYLHQDELKIILSSSKYVWQAYEFENG